VVQSKIIPGYVNDKLMLIGISSLEIALKEAGHY